MYSFITISIIIGSLLNSVSAQLFGPVYPILADPVPYGQNVDGYSISQLWTKAATRSYTQLTAEAYNQYTAANPLNPTLQLLANDPMCGTASPFSCMVYDLTTEVKRVLGVPVQVKSGYCPITSALPCIDTNSKAITTGSSNAVGVTVGGKFDFFGVLGVSASTNYAHTWESSTTTTTSFSCAANPGHTSCVTFESAFLSGTFGCTLKGYFENPTTVGQPFHTVTTWVCPAIVPFEYKSPVYSPSSASGVGIFSCAFDAQCQLGATPMTPSS